MGPLLDTVLVCAVGTILLIRTELWLTNYPQLGGHGLHIAHLFWGGLAMLIAIVILVSFLGPFALQRRRELTPREYLVNALELAKDGAVRDMDAEEQRQALALLDHADRSDPLVARTRELLEAVPIRADAEPSLGTKLVRSARGRYFRLTENRWFIRIVTTLFGL